MMRQLFPGYYRPTETEFSEMWRTCIFAFDTNVLLNFYRYSVNTQQRLFDILSQLQDRIWLPHHVAFEYQKNRPTVIAEQLRAYNGVNKVLDDSVKALEKDLSAFQRHSFIDTAHIKSLLLSAVEEVKAMLQEREAQHPNLLDRDDIRERIDDLFDGRIGQGYSEKVLAEQYRKADDRYKKQLPPGYKDVGKGGVDQFGDAIIWFQLIDRVRDAKQPIIFTTADTKDDWWLRVSGQTLGPLPQLIQEMLAEAGVGFYLYHIDQFMNRAEEFLQLQTEQAAIEEVRELRLEDEQARTVLEDIAHARDVAAGDIGNRTSYGAAIPSSAALTAVQQALGTRPAFDIVRTSELIQQALSAGPAFDAVRAAEAAQRALPAGLAFDAVRAAELIQQALPAGPAFDAVRAAELIQQVLPAGPAFDAVRAAELVQQALESSAALDSARAVQAGSLPARSEQQLQGPQPSYTDRTPEQPLTSSRTEEESQVSASENE